ncbi:Ran-binding protein 9 [Orbilia ellipsospora]|uniref:Ran-binding protein 9 n=1 Tax=Orbilia ellipsospora TaxID=2528407 RepID=A0AAV9XUI2_9PEZI
MDGVTPLFAAVDRDRFCCAQYLLNAGADDQAKNTNDQTIWHNICRRITSESLRHPRNASDYDMDSNQLLEAQPVKFFIDKLFNPTFSKLDFSAFFPGTHLVASDKILEFIYSKQTDFNIVDDANWDCFDWAYSCGRHELVCQITNRSIDFDGRAQQMQSKENERGPSCWSVEHTNSMFDLSDDGLTISYKCRVEEGNDRGAIWTQLPVSPYIKLFYYEVTILSAWTADNLPLMVGFTSGQLPSDKLPGWSYETPIAKGRAYALHTDNGRLYSPVAPDPFDDGEEDKEYMDYCPSKFLPGKYRVYLKVGDTIGCGYDQNDHTLFWTRNVQTPISDQNLNYRTKLGR